MRDTNARCVKAHHLLAMQPRSRMAVGQALGWRARGPGGARAEGPAPSGAGPAGRAPARARPDRGSRVAKEVSLGLWPRRGRADWAEKRCKIQGLHAHGGELVERLAERLAADA